jgi:hypothetical protein
MAEDIEFCTYYLGIDWVRVPESCHEGGLRGKGTIDEKAIIVDDVVAFRQSLFSISFISVNSTTRSTLFVFHLCRSISSFLNDIARNLNTKGY